MNEFTLSVTHNTGAVFSKFMILVQNIAEINPNFEKVYLLNRDERSLTGENNVFNFIFDQIPWLPEKKSTRRVGTYTSKNKIEDSNNLENYKKIVKKLKFSKEFLKYFDKCNDDLKIDDTFLGVHVRLTDANIYHPYSQNNYMDFLNLIQTHRKENQKIFVASDNDESLEKLEKEFGDDLFYLKNCIRGKTEQEDTFKLMVKNFKDPNLWREAFAEMLLLSKCGTLICRSSNVNNASIIYSNTIKKIIRL